MKKFIFIVFILSVKLLYCQNIRDEFCLTFEDTISLSYLITDTSSSNIWQIATIQKFTSDSELMNNHAIVTDSINSYPINNTSSFIIQSQATYGDIYGFKNFSGDYFTETDSLHDFGKIEFSYNNGSTWIDIINDTAYSSNFVWYTPKPILTGHSGNVNQNHFDVIFVENGAVFNIHLGDTLLYKFTFQSDSIFNNMKGLYFDNLCFFDFVEGISEIRFKPIKSKIFPNPSDDYFTIEFDNQANESFQLAVYDIHSKPVLSRENIVTNKVSFDTQNLNSGTYVYKLTNLNSKKRSWGKFIIQK